MTAPKKGVHGEPCAGCGKEPRGFYEVDFVAISHGHESRLWSTDKVLCRGCAWKALHDVSLLRLREFPSESRAGMIAAGAETKKLRAGMIAAGAETKKLRAVVDAVGRWVECLDDGADPMKRSDLALEVIEAYKLQALDGE